MTLPKALPPAALAALLLAFGPSAVQAQSSDDAPAATEEAAAADGGDDLDDAYVDEDELLDDDTLDELVAPVALYPDGLLAQVFVAATYPLEVVKADRWIDDNDDLDDAARADAATEEDWDPSVAALVAGFPDVIGRMADDLDWTESLGDALLVQPDDVLDAVQRQRSRAAAVGNLESNPAQTVTVEGDDITIAPADPQVVYVPQYDPQTAYVTASNPAPVIVQESGGSGYDGTDLLVTGAVAFGAGILVNEIFSDDDDYWGRNYGPNYYGGGYRPFRWDDRGFYPNRGRGPVYVEGDVNINRNRRHVDRDGKWQPDRRDRDEAKKRLDRKHGDRHASRNDRDRNDRNRADRNDRDRNDRDRNDRNRADRNDRDRNDRNRADRNDRDRSDRNRASGGGGRDDLRRKMQARSDGGGGGDAGRKPHRAEGKDFKSKPKAGRKDAAFSGARGGDHGKARKEIDRGSKSATKAKLPSAERHTAKRKTAAPAKRKISRPAQPKKAVSRPSGGGRTGGAFAKRSGGGHAKAAARGGRHKGKVGKRRR